MDIGEKYVDNGKRITLRKWWSTFPSHSWVYFISMMLWWN